MLTYVSEAEEQEDQAKKDSIMQIHIENMRAKTKEVVDMIIS